MLQCHGPILSSQTMGDHSVHAWDICQGYWVLIGSWMYKVYAPPAKMVDKSNDEIIHTIMHICTVIKHVDLRDPVLSGIMVDCK